jgi:pimeloyl-ACP methyl ester carboxylesterase
MLAGLIPIEYYYKFKQQLPKADYATIADAGHAPFVEKTALVYEKLRTFLMQDETSVA